ncbi:hypothetical protein F511_28598 [Dorcoceras hygrometricum]|uniref:ICln family transporter: chloride ion current inducer protein I(Cln) n=1 Tax=Dorcoceras hygrometricum TaxID=472368 RepID=A0A2Z7ADK8_9LAMI|nr:hypothetical protein F511_28598 [Dorcoceras hygrometricum]
MLYVNGEWVVEPCADRWVKIPKLVISTEVPHQRQYDDTLPTMSVFFKLMTKRWADLAEPVSRIAPSRSPVFALRVSQFCSIFVDMSFFNWFPSAEITEFLSEIALDRTVLRSVQSFQNYFSVAPSVQLSLEQQQSSSFSTSSSSSLHFDKTDVDATASSVPPVSQDLSAAFADLQANLSEHIFEYQSGLSSKLHKIEQSVCDSLRDQADIFRNLSQGARQEARTLDDVQSIRFNEFRKNVLTQNASIFQGLADVRQEVQAVNAKVDIMASRFNAIQKDAELSELVDYIHRGSADKKGESGSRGLQQPANVQIEGSAERPTFAQRVEMAQRHIVQKVLDADANRALLARQDAAERDRERRRREARACRTLQEIVLSIYDGISAVGVFVRIQQMVCDKQLNGLSSSADRFIKSNQQMLLSRSAGEFFQAFFQSKLLTTTMDVSAGYQSNFRRKLKVFQIRSFAHKEKICTIVQLPGMKETS